MASHGTLNSKIHEQNFREFLERALHKTLDVCQVLAGGGAVFSLESAQRLATQKFACNADSAEIVQIFRAKVESQIRCKFFACLMRNTPQIQPASLQNVEM